MMNTDQILKAFGGLLRKDRRLLEIANKAADYTDAQAYATEAADRLCYVLGKYTNVSELSQDDALYLFTAVLKRNHEAVAKVCEAVQARINEEAGLGLGTLAPDFKPSKVEKLVQTITETENASDDYIRNLVINHSVEIVDEAIRQNAEADDNLGLDVHITRTYDGVGLHDGKQTCTWCTSRCGSWDNYSEALHAGCFERHPGCGCIITYHVGKTRTWSNKQSQWRSV